MRKLIYFAVIVAVIFVLMLMNVCAEELETEEGDDIGEAITSTKKDETNNSQISFKCHMPEGFNLGVGAEFMNEDTGAVYRIIATASNDYSARMWIPAGTYHMLVISVCEDAVNEYLMVQGNDFVIEAGSNHSIESTLVNYDEIKAEIEHRFGDEYDETVDEPESVVKNETSTESSRSEVVPWRKFVHTGDGHGELILSGTATEKIDLIVQITTTGSYRGGEYRYSTDNGATWSKVAIINGTCDIYRTDEESAGIIDTGLKIGFVNSDTYLVYDEYRYSSELEYDFTPDIQLGKGEIRMWSEDVLYDFDTKIRIRIEKTGPCGIATFRYCMDYRENAAEAVLNRWSDEIVVPADGEYQIPDTGIRLTFWDGFGVFAVGDEYMCNLETEKSKRDYRPYIFGIFGGLLLMGTVATVYLRSLKEDPREYKLNTYRKVVLPEKKRRP